MHLLKNPNKQVLVHNIPLFLMLANIQFVWLLSFTNSDIQLQLNY